jgi:hypothetical protein
MKPVAQRILQLLDGFPVTPELVEWISAASQKELDELLRFTYDFIGERHTDKLPEPQGI